MKVKHLRKFLETLDQELEVDICGADTYYELYFAEVFSTSVDLNLYEPSEGNKDPQYYREIPQED